MATVNQVGLGLSGSTGTGSFVGSTSPTLVTPTLGIASATSITFSSTTGIIGTTTNNSAPVGSVGSLVSSIISSPGSSITNNTNTNITSLISLPAGDWDVWGNVGFAFAATTSTTFMAGWTSITSATRPDASLYANYNFLGAGGAIVPAGNTINIKVPTGRYRLAAPTTIYLSSYILFTVSTVTTYGAIYAREAR